MLSGLEHSQHGDAPVLPRSLSCRLEAGQPDEGHRGCNGQGPDVFQQSPRQAEEADDHFYQ